MSIYYFYKEEVDMPFTYLTPTRMAGQINPPYNTMMLPNDYLEFAISDFKDSSERGLVNAFGNAKRALHLAIDIVLHQYGLFKYYRKTNFPTKLQVLDEIGIFPTNIIKNLNVERNLIEHEYDAPPHKRVGEAIDVVKLLLLALDKLMEATPFEVVVGWRKPKKHCVIQLEPVQGMINLYTLNAKGMYKKIHGITYFYSNLRTFGGDFSEGVKISQTPWKVITLEKNEIQDWKPIISELVNVQRKNRANYIRLDKEAGTITTSITIPMPHFEKTTWSEILDRSMKNRFQNSDNDKKKDEDPDNS